MMPALTITQAGDADLGLIRAVAAGQAVSIDPALLAAVQQRCTEARQALRDGRAVYGVNTGMGALSSVRLTEQQQLSHQRNLLLARATGGPPWLSRPDVRAVITVRLLTFLSGDAAVSAGLCQRLADFLNYDIAPAVPCAGAAAAGEIIQLAHAFGPVVGIGQVLGPGGDLMPADEALSDHGLTEFSLGPKEGIALIQGVPGATGLSVLRLGEAAALASLMEAAAALSIVVARAPRDPYRAACGRGDDLLAAVLRRIREAAGDDPSPRSLQAPVSFRVAGPVLAQVQRAAGQLEAATRRALIGVTDSPAYLDGRFTSTGRVPRNRPVRALRPAHGGVVPCGGGGGGTPAPADGSQGHRAAPAASPRAGPAGRPDGSSQARRRRGPRHEAAGRRDRGRADRDVRRPGGRAVVRLGGRRETPDRVAPCPRGHRV